MEIFTLRNLFKSKRKKAPRQVLNLIQVPKYPWIFSLKITWTCPAMSLESQYALTTLPPSFYLAITPASKASYSASLFVAEKPSLRDFSKVIPFGEIIMIPLPNPFWLAAPSTNSCYTCWISIELTLSASSSFVPSLESPNSSVNSANKSAKI